MTIPRFPSCFPVDFEEKLLPKDLPDIELSPVYRICTTGKIQKNSFLSTYEEDLMNPNRKRHSLNDPGTFGTSVFMTPQTTKNALKCLTRHHPEAYIIIGTASSSLGPVQETYNRTHNKRDKDHVDWWLYADSDPSHIFKRYEQEIETQKE